MTHRSLSPRASPIRGQAAPRLLRVRLYRRGMVSGVDCGSLGAGVVPRPCDPVGVAPVAVACAARCAPTPRRLSPASWASWLIRSQATRFAVSHTTITLSCIKQPSCFDRTKEPCSLTLVHTTQLLPDSHGLTATTPPSLQTGDAIAHGSARQGQHMEPGSCCQRWRGG